MVVDHVAAGPPPAATSEQLAAAERYLQQRLNRSPIEQIHTFSRRAEIAAWKEGNYDAAVLAAAVACELAVKLVAWMIYFEETGGHPASGDWEGILVLRPAQLIGRVLQPRLGGSWASEKPTTPVGRWRFHVARRRNDLLHLGRSSTAAEADEAIHAMRGFVTYLLDRLAVRSVSYPLTAFCAIGPDGLERRGRSAAIEQSLKAKHGSPAEWVVSYTAFLAEHLRGIE